MRKIKFGRSSTLKPVTTVFAKKTELDQSLIKGIQETIDSEMLVVSKKVMETHSATLKKLAKHDITFSSKIDKRARQHSRLSLIKTGKIIDGVIEGLNIQNESIHNLRQLIQKTQLELETTKFELNRVAAVKPEQIHIVNETIKHISIPQSKPLIAAVILSIVLSIIAIVINK